MAKPVKAVGKDGSSQDTGVTEARDLIFEATDASGRGLLRTECAEIDALLSDLEDQGKQGTPQHSVLCKRPEAILRASVPCEAATTALDDFEGLGGMKGLSHEFAEKVMKEHAKLDKEECKSLYHVRTSGEVRRTIGKEGVAFAIRYVANCNAVQVGARARPLPTARSPHPTPPHPCPSPRSCALASPLVRRTHVLMLRAPACAVCMCRTSALRRSHGRSRSSSRRSTPTQARCWAKRT